MRTFTPSADKIERQWHVIDAGDQVLGRVATVAAKLLQGKHKADLHALPRYGDHVVVVINAARVKLTGRKEEQKLYRHHSGYKGGLGKSGRRTSVRSTRCGWSKRRSEACCRRRSWATRCIASSRSTAGAEHPHAAQKPTQFKVA